MSDLDIVVENILDEDNDVELEKETNKIPEPSLGEAIAYSEKPQNCTQHKIQYWQISQK